MIAKVFRVLKIAQVVLRYGLDEILLSGVRLPASFRLISVIFFWRDLSTARGVRLRGEALG